MTAEASSDVKFEIGHVLFIDIAGYSKFLINEQSELIRELKGIVRGTKQVRLAEAEDKLVLLPTGDGMALIFRNSPEAPVQCALEIAQAVKAHPQIQLRMGIHSGPVNEVADVNERMNVAGAGIDIAQRVMDCGDAGHILLSKHVADDLAPYPRWNPYLHDLGECEVKHGWRVSIVNLYADQVGNPQLPKKFEALKKDSARMRRAATTAALLALAAIVAGIAMFSRFRVGSTLAAPEKSIAVLPFENLSEDKANAYFADGIQDELLSNLAKIKDLKVTSRTSVMQYKADITRNLKEIAQQLGVSNVVEGSVRRSGNHVRVSVQLIDGLTDRHILAQNYDRTLADSLALQAELATKIAAEVGATLSPQEKVRVEAKPTNNTAAYDAYLRGRAFKTGVAWAENAEGAIRSYQEAVKLDPNFALAWAYLSCAQIGSYHGEPNSNPGSLAAAKDALDHALALDPNLPETHLALGYYRYYGQRDYTGGLAEFQQAEKGLPNNVDVLEAIALIQRRLGQWDDAIEAARHAVELDPRNSANSIVLAEIYMALRHFPEALATADRLLAVEPTNEGAVGVKVAVFWRTGDLKAAESLLANLAEPVMHGVQAMWQRRYAAATELFSKGLADKPNLDWGLFVRLGLNQQRAGDVAAARATYQKATQEIQRELEKPALDPYRDEWLHTNLGWAYAGLGEAASAVAEGQKAMVVRPTSKDAFDGPKIEEHIAEIYALLGDADHAIPILKRLLQIPYSLPITPPRLRLDPVWDSIRNDRRFQELVAERQGESK